MPVTIQHIVCLAIIFKLILQPQSANMFIRLLTFSRAIYIFISFDKLCAAAAVAAYQFANFNDKYTLWYRPHSPSRRNKRRKYTSKDLEMEGGKEEKAAWGHAMWSGLAESFGILFRVGAESHDLPQCSQVKAVHTPDHLSSPSS